MHIISDEWMLFGSCNLYTHLFILIILYCVLYIRQILHTFLFLFYSEFTMCEKERAGEKCVNGPRSMPKESV